MMRCFLVVPFVLLSAGCPRVALADQQHIFVDAVVEDDERHTGAVPTAPIRTFARAAAQLAALLSAPEPARDIVVELCGALRVPVGGLRLTSAHGALGRRRRVRVELGRRGLARARGLPDRDEPPRRRARGRPVGAAE